MSWRSPTSSGPAAPPSSTWQRAGPTGPNPATPCGSSGLYVRSAYGPTSTWFRRALRHGRGRIRAGGVEHDVSFEHLTSAGSVHAAIDAAFHAKYDRYGPRIVGSVVGPAAAEVTLRLHHGAPPPPG